jgi:cellulose synthase/poly-beta-1,6-N-acetylglucosamine synthase-like glycosyltransferase
MTSYRRRDDSEVRSCRVALEEPAVSTPLAVGRTGRELEAPYEVQYERLPEPFWVPLLFWLWCLVAIPYGIWRISVANYSTPFGVLLLLPEMFSLLLTLMFLGTSQKVYMPIHRPTDLSLWVVDCIIPTHLEPPDVIECTVLGALRVRGVRNVLVAANYERREIREVCERLGARYLPRGSNEHAKAGNLNNALTFTDAPFVMLLDADHIARPDMLESLMGWFDDPRVAFAQGPQLYYNSDSLLFRRFHGVPAGWSEQTMFYQVVQPSKNRWNAACFVGSSAVLRRAALDQIGGFATGTATEDIHTSIRLHAKGWKGVYTNQPVAYGLEAPSLREFYTQRRRWAAGSAGLCLRSKDSPLYARGLTFMQRFNYFNSTISHALGPLRAAQIAVPLFCITTLIPPVTTKATTFIFAAMSYFLFSGLLSYLYARGAMHFLHVEAYSYANHAAMSFGMVGMFRVQRKFVAARKNVSPNEKTWVRRYLWGVAWLGVAGATLGIIRYLGGNHSSTVVWSTFFILVNEFWMLWFLVYLWRYEAYSRHAPPPMHQQLRGLDRYHYVLNAFSGPYIMPSGIALDHPVRMTRRRVRPGREPLASTVHRGVS